MAPKTSHHKSDTKQRHRRTADSSQRLQSTALQAPVEKRPRKKGGARKLWSGWLTKGRDKARNVLRRQSTQEPIAGDPAEPVEDLASSYVHVPPNPASPNDGSQDGKPPTRRTSANVVAKPSEASSLAASLRKISEQRARVYHEQYGVREQSKHMQHQRNEVAKASASLIQEIESTKLYPKLLTLAMEVQRTLDGLATAESEMDYLNERLLEKGEMLRKAEDQLYHNLTGQELLHGIDLVNDVLNQISSLPGSQRWGPASSRMGSSHEGSFRYDLEEGRTEFVSNVDQANAEANVPIWNSDQEQPQEEGQEEENENVYPPWQPELASLPDLDNLFLEHLVQVEPTLQTDCDKDVFLTGIQFNSVDVDNNCVDEQLKTTDDELLVEEKRVYDLAPVVDMKSMTGVKWLTNLETPAEHETVAPSLDQIIGVWMLQIFTSSWLELSRWIQLSETHLKKLISIIGYINLGLLIRENWFCDGSGRQLEKDTSIYPSVSNVTDDVPQFLTQVVVYESDGEAHEPEYYHLSNDYPQPKRIRHASNVAQPVQSQRSLLDQSSSSKDSLEDSIFSRRVKRRETTKTEPQSNNIEYNCDTTTMNFSAR